MNSKAAVDRHARRIARASSLIAGSVAVFWIIQLVRGAAPLGELLIVNIFSFGAVAMFGRLTKEGGTIDVLAMCVFLSSVGRMETQDLGVPGRVTFLAAVVLVVSDLVLHDRRRRAAEPAVAADGLRPPLNG